jgi:formyltetrahydrofolate deformylase
MYSEFILTLSCDDRPGLVADVTNFLFRAGANITDAQQFNDSLTGRFFMRIAFRCEGQVAAEQLSAGFAPIARERGMEWRLHSTSERMRVLLLVSKMDHCLTDLLYRVRIDELRMDVVGIVSNHPKHALPSALPDNIPFHHLPITPETKPQQEAQIKKIVDDTGAELIVLARYMQILSDDMSAFLSGRCINIHHSFLPGFKGARPYHQAHDRGVKMIGATAHYVTHDLDEGPIIHQDVESVTHADTPAILIRKGRDIERRVLARAVHYHLDMRVIINGRTTVVFKD